MSSTGNVRPMRLWQSVLLFGLPALYGVFANYVLFPSLVSLGFSQENAYHTAHLTVFVLLFALTIIALRADGWPLRWSTLAERLRFKPMDATAWKWTLPLTVVYLAMGLLLNMLAGFLYEIIGFLPPEPDVPLTNVPFLLVVLIMNIVSEEMWWRGYILPRQELAHGKLAWAVNGILWSLFHIFKWWAVPFMLVREWMIPFVAQRTKNTTPPFLIHLVSNGLGLLLSIIPLL